MGSLILETPPCKKWWCLSNVSLNPTIRNGQDMLKSVHNTQIQRPNTPLGDKGFMGKQCLLIFTLFK